MASGQCHACKSGPRRQLCPPFESRSSAAKHIQPNIYTAREPICAYAGFIVLKLWFCSVCFFA